MTKQSNLSMVLGFFFFASFAVLFGWSFYISRPEVKVATLSFLAAAFAGIYSHYASRKREIEARHYTEKREAYGEIIELVFELFKNVKAGTVLPQEQLQSKLLLFKKKLMIWGSSEAIDAWTNYESLDHSKNAAAVFAALEEIFRVIRRELGHDDHGLKFGSLTGLLLTTDARSTAFPELKSKATNAHAEGRTPLGSGDWAKAEL